MFKLGLTGGIGSGKSTVASFLHQMGAALIDADAISRQSTQAGGMAIDAIREAFGVHMLTRDHALNRQAMRELIASRPEVKVQLEAIVHPIVKKQINTQLQAALAADRNIAVLDIPLLVEAGMRWRSTLDAVWVVDCSPDTQFERVRVRSAWPDEQIRSIMSLQATRGQRLACADAVICNEGISLDTLRTIAQQMAKPLL